MKRNNSDKELEERDRQLLSDFLEFATTGHQKHLLLGSKRQTIVDNFLNCSHKEAYLIGGKTSKCPDCNKIILPTGKAVVYYKQITLK